MMCFVLCILFFVIGLWSGNVVARMTNAELFEAMQKMDRQKLAQALGQSNPDYLQQRRKP